MNLPWRSYYERNPWLFVAAAFGGGLLLSAAMRARRGASAQQPQEQREGEAAAADSGSRKHSTGASETWERIKAALLAAAGSQISSFVRELLPGMLGASRPSRQADGPDERSQNGPSRGGAGNGQATGEAAAQ
jgi:hypothetical protein